MPVRVVDGDLLDQPVEVIVNAWNRNTIPWWLLLPQGVSGAIKRRGGTTPFRELRRHGRMALGQAIETSAGTLPLRAIIHVAGIDDFWRGSEATTRACVRSALELAVGRGLRSVALPLIGSGSGGLSPERAEVVTVEEAERFGDRIDVLVVRYRK